jgi:FtsH-binding integral membrane protein
MFEDNIFQKSESKFINKTLFQMGAGLFITFIVAYLVSNSTAILNIVFANSFMWLAFLVVEVGLVRYLSRNIEKLSYNSARMWFYIYSAINGLTFSAIFVVYDLGSIASVFIVASAMFFCCSMIGITTKVNLAPFGRILMMALIGLIICVVLNLFFHSSQLELGITILGIVLFCALTAYDMQKIKQFHQYSYSVDSQQVDKYAIVSALEIYLDFINLFIYLLRLFGKKR